MKKNSPGAKAFTLVVFVAFSSPLCSGAQVSTTSYPARAPIDQYMIGDESAEISLARTAAPASISSAAEVMVLRRDSYATVVKGSNGFVCLVERSWGNTTVDPQFWNPRIRAPHCFNQPAAQSVLPMYLLKSRLVLSDKSTSDIAAAISSALEKKVFPPLSLGTMVYMMSKQQYLDDTHTTWHPHLMFFASGDAEKTWGANLPGSPVMAAFDPEQRVTTFFVLAGEWSDGTPAPSTH